MTVTPRTVLIVAAGLLLAACSSDDGSPDTSTGDTTGAAPTEASATWSYEGDTGPESWGSLSAENELCDTGTEQSPIDLTGAVEEDIADIDFTYGETPLAIYNNGHTIEVEVEEGSSIEIPDGTYEVTQFHFHAGSEHTVDAEQSPMEMHIVHRSTEGGLAVVGVMLEVGAENEALGPVFDHIPTEVGDEAETVDGETVDLAAVLPDTRTYYQYPGSLTTPPCSEDVAWQVLTTPVEISQDQLEAFTTVVDGNARPVQPIGDRTLTEDIAQGS
jgi:carbonic anhydrase